MNLQKILDYDKNLLISLQSVIPHEYAGITIIIAESIVIWCALFLIGLWLYGVSKKDNAYKILALQIFGLIASIFIIYSLVNLAIPQWRPNPATIL